MKKTLLTMFIVCTGSLTALGAGSFSAKVTHVSDGDTFTVTIADGKTFRIRLKGIDAPEKDQPFGDKAKTALSALVMNKQVRIDWSGYDDYQRLLATVISGSTWVNQHMVAEGWAWHYIFYDKNPQLNSAQIKARATQKGLWAGTSPTAPWDWRKKVNTKRTGVKAGTIRIASLLPNPQGRDEGKEQVTLVNMTGKEVALRGWSLRDKQKNTYALSGSIKPKGRLVITIKNNRMPLNNDGDTITLLEGKSVRHTFTYNKNQAGIGVVVKAGKK
tara:strand:- start:2062 stop:2880 length:819 start_codon:yes stop_codon:yes gene_type:complete